MKRIPLLFALLILAATSYADVIIFRGTLSARFVGHGNERVLNERTITIADVDGTNAARIETIVIQGHKFYHVDYSPGTVFGTTVRGANGRVYRVSGEASSMTNEFAGTQIRAGFSRGLQTKVAIKPGRVLDVPRVSRGHGTSIEQEDGEYGVIESTSTRIVSQAETVDANARGETVEQVTARLIQKIESQGYINSP